MNENLLKGDDYCVSKEQIHHTCNTVTDMYLSPSALFPIKLGLHHHGLCCG